MSNRIKEIIEVIGEARKIFLEDETDSVRSVRIQAVRNVAKKRHIDDRSVLDKCSRQLQPDIKEISDFDSFVAEWLMSGSKRIQEIILKHTSDDEDISRVNDFFETVEISDVDIAIEFGLAPTEKVFREGKSFMKIHLVKERNNALVREAKLLWDKEQNSNMLCSICDFSFSECYGERGKGYIEAHHKVAISALTSETEVSIDDLAPVCSNCHRILHRRRPWLSVEELRDIVRGNSP